MSSAGKKRHDDKRRSRRDTGFAEKKSRANNERAGPPYPASAVGQRADEETWSGDPPSLNRWCTIAPSYGVDFSRRFPSSPSDPPVVEPLAERERERAGLRTAESRLAMARAQIAFRPKDSRLSLLENAFFSGCTVKQSRGNPRTADEALLPSAISS